MAKPRGYWGRRQAAYRKKHAPTVIPRVPVPKGRIQETKLDPMLGILFGAVVRDGPFCHICGLCCDLRVTTKLTPITATRDHLQPKSKGGEDGLENIKLCHNYCNHKRGSEMITEEMRAQCRSWIEANVGIYILADCESWYNAFVRPQLPRPAKNAAEEYSATYRAMVAKRQDIFYRCVQGGLMSGK